MNRKVLVSLFASLILLVVVAAVIVVAETTIQKTELYVEGTVFYMTPTEPPEPSVEASATLSGNLTEKDGKYYLSPLNGTITVGDADSKILAKPLKTSEPMEYFEIEYIDEGGYLVKNQNWSMTIQVNIGGDKSMGFVGIGKFYHELIGEMEFSYLNFYGVKEGRMIACEMSYPPLPPPPMG